MTIHKELKKYAAVYNANWSTTLQYRGDFALWGIAQAIAPLIALAIWYTISITNGNFAPEQALAYYIAILFLNPIVHGPDGFIFGQEILLGKFTQHIIKPYQPWLLYLTQGINIRSMFLVMFTPVFIILAIVAPSLFVGLAFSPTTVALTLISVLLGIGVFYSMDMFLATTAFWFEESHDIRRLRHVVEAIASGVFVPYALMPDTLRTTLSFLPFRYILSAPVEIITGQAVGAEAFTLLGIQAAWIACLGTAFAIALRAGIKVYAPPTQ